MKIERVLTGLTVALQGVPVALLWVILSHSQQLTHDRVNEMVSMGIQKLVSTYEIRKTLWGLGGTPDQLKSKVPRSAQIFIFRGVVGTPDQHS